MALTGAILPLEGYGCRMHIQPREILQHSANALPIAARGIWEESMKSASAVTLCPDGETLIEAELRDVTPTGFRIYYPGVALPLGLEVDILYSWGKVAALVVSVGQVELGSEVDFLITG
jgi:hypothetical protein